MVHEIRAHELRAQENGADAGAAKATRPVELSRRGVLRKAAAAAAVTAVGATVISDRGAASASAATGAAVTSGTINTAETSTELEYDGSAALEGVVFLANDTEFIASDSAFPAALGGWGGRHVPHGIYGFTESSDGHAIVAVKAGAVPATGAAVHAEASGGGTLAVFAGNTEGTAILGTSDDNAEGAIAVRGVLTPDDAGDGSAAVFGDNKGTNQLGSGVKGSHHGAGVGVLATAVDGFGVVADGGTGTGLSAIGSFGLVAQSRASNGTAVSATSNSKATAVDVKNFGSGVGLHSVVGPQPALVDRAAAAAAPESIAIFGESSKGRGGVFGGGAAQLRLEPGTKPSHPSDGLAGDLYVDRGGRLWFCTAGGNPATWKQVA